MEPEQALTGGNVTTGLVRIGDTVRRPAGSWTPAIHALLVHLHDAGFPHAPRSFGLDDEGRHVVEFIPGEVAHPFTPLGETREAALFTIGAIARRLHDVLAEFVPPPDAHWESPIPPDGTEQIVHNDLAPWNLVRSAKGLVFIDWDGAAPGTRMWDLSYAAHGFVPLSPAVLVSSAGSGLRALAEGYRLDEAGRHGLATLLARRARSMYDLLAHGHATGQLPWSRLWDEGHGRVWLADTEWIERWATQLRQALVATHS
jgi:Ser/Thr protein kinase RdoA (MazF antagonist)